MRFSKRFIFQCEEIFVSLSVTPRRDVSKTRKFQFFEKLLDTIPHFAESLEVTLRLLNKIQLILVIVKVRLLNVISSSTFLASNSFAIGVEGEIA